LARRYSDTRNLILNSAVALLQSAGIRGASLDVIAASAGVTKKTLYYHFRSKDDLVAAALMRSDAGYRGVAIPAEPQLAEPGELVDRLLSDVASFTANPYCAVIRAAFELVGMPGHPGLAAAQHQKRQLEQALIAGFEASGFVEAKSVARRLVLLLDGAITNSLIYHDPQYAIEGRKLAHEIVLAAKRMATDPSIESATVGEPGKIALNQTAASCPLVLL
jgi:AcrR family transcriptional regulator